METRARWRAYTVVWGVAVHGCSHVLNFEQVSVNIDKYFTIYQQLLINIHRYWSILAGNGQSMSTSIGQCQQVSVNISRYRSTSAGISQYQEVSVNIGKYQSILAGRQVSLNISIKVWIAKIISIMVLLVRDQSFKHYWGMGGGWKLFGAQI